MWTCVRGLDKSEQSECFAVIYTPQGIVGYSLLCKLHALFPVVIIVVSLAPIQHALEFCIRLIKLQHLVDVFMEDSCQKAQFYVCDVVVRMI